MSDGMMQGHPAPEIVRESRVDLRFEAGHYFEE